MDGGKVSGSRTNVLIISNLRTTDAGAYYLKVSNRVGSVTSSNATLTVVGHHTGNDNASILNNLLAGVTSAKPAAVTAQAVLGTVPAPLNIGALVRNSDGSVTLNGTAPAGSNCVVQASVDLTAWSGIATNTADINGQWSAKDTAAAAHPVRFYRAATP